MAYKGVRDLDVYSLGFDLALKIHHLSQLWPKNEQYGGMADQIRRASKSVCANLVEGFERKSSVNEEIRFLSIAMGSCHEVRLWLDFAVALDFPDKQQMNSLQDGYRRVGEMLFGLVRARKGTKAGTSYNGLETNQKELGYDDGMA